MTDVVLYMTDYCGGRSRIQIASTCGPVHEHVTLDAIIIKISGGAGLASPRS